MKKSLKIAAYLFGALILVVAVLLVYVKTFLPNVGDPPDLTVIADAEMIEHGDYLANHVMVCMDCHSTRNWELFSGPLVPGTLGKGGEIFDQNMGFPGKYVSSNITPVGLSEWTDGELFRVITTGVNRKGKAMFPVMPYLNYGKLDESDIKSVIAYIRTLEPIDFIPEESSPDFPFNFILNTIPKPASPQATPSKNNPVEYGAYMSLASSCMDCHTVIEGGKIAGELYAGGAAFKFPDGTITYAPNITPDATGIGNWPKEQFINRFKMYVDSVYTAPKVGNGDFKTVMPWTMYADMKQADLEALYSYFQSIDPVENVVVRFEASEDEI